jgi:PKD repeat protein
LAWDFGDGSPIDTNNYPSHLYAAPGTYNVCLSLVTTSGCNINVCQNITVYDYSSSCTTTLSNYNDITNSNDYSFTIFASAPGNSSFLINAITNLDFGDGTSQTFSSDSLGFCGAFSVIHTYNAAGTYIVTATTTNSLGCVSSDSDTITVIMPAVYNCDLFLQTTAYTISMSGYASSLSINITNYEWSYGDGIIENSPNSYIHHTYSALGDYEVCVTSTAANGCTSTSCDSVTISSYGSITGYTNTLSILPPDSNTSSFILKICSLAGITI